MKKLMLAVVAVGCLAIVGCDEKKDGAKGDSSAKASSGGSAAAASGDSTGIPECDDYLKKAEACTAKMPAEGKAAWETGIKTSRDAWKEGAKQEAAKAGIKTACEAAAKALTDNPVCK